MDGAPQRVGWDGDRTCQAPGVEFLSPDWLAALDAAARARPVDGSAPDGSPEAHRAPGNAPVTFAVAQQVTDGPSWILRLVEGRASVDTAPSASDVHNADIRLTSNEATAAAVASGALSALEAFTTGRLQVGGDIDGLLANREALERLGDVFAAVRDETTFPTPPAD